MLKCNYTKQRRNPKMLSICSSPFPFDTLPNINLIFFNLRKYPLSLPSPLSFSSITWYIYNYFAFWKSHLPDGIHRFVSDRDYFVLKELKVTIVPVHAKIYKNTFEGFKLEKFTNFSQTEEGIPLVPEAQIFYTAGGQPIKSWKECEMNPQRCRISLLIRKLCSE